MREPDKRATQSTLEHRLLRPIKGLEVREGGSEGGEGTRRERKGERV